MVVSKWVVLTSMKIAEGDMLAKCEEKVSHYTFTIRKHVKSINQSIKRNCLYLLNNGEL